MFFISQRPNRLYQIMPRGYVIKTEGTVSGPGAARGWAHGAQAPRIMLDCTQSVPDYLIGANLQSKKSGTKHGAE